MTQEPATQKDEIHINTALVLATLSTLLPLLGIFVIQNAWWGVLIKIILAIFLFATLKNYFFHPMWEKASGFGAGIILNMLWFSCFWFFTAPWVSFACTVLFMLGIGTMRRTLKLHYDDAV